MPSSLIIIGLAAAWLVVLVPMVARKRQEVTQTSDSALAGRIVRSGTRNNGRREFAVSRDANTREDRDEDVDAHEVYDEDVDDYESDYVDDEYDDRAERYDDERYDDEYADVGRDDHDYGAGHYGYGYEHDDYDYDDYDDGAHAVDEPPRRQYRPGRGGFDPEAAEATARAKYAYRQRVVLTLLIAAVVTAILAAVVAPVVWWLHGIVDLALVGYLGYLRRQVRIEEEIRQRRMARYSGEGRRPRRDPQPERYADVEQYRRAGDVDEADYRDDWDDGYEDDYRQDDYREDDRDDDRGGVSGRPGPELVSVERRRAPRPPRNAVVVDLEDEDPAFHELGDPGELPYRRAAGE